MANTSATGGFLTPADPLAPEQDIDLDKLFQATTAGITGLAGSLVRPRWQPGSPKQPEASVNWCAISAMLIDPDAGPAIIHNPASDGADGLIRHEDITVLASFYGPNGARYAAILRDGIGIHQNTEALSAYGIRFVDDGPIRQVPEFVNQQWIRRADISLRFRRKVSRTYPVQNVLSADIHLFDDTTHVDETIPVPPAP